MKAQRVWASVFLASALAVYSIPSALQQDVAPMIRLSLLRPFVTVRSVVSQIRIRNAEAEGLRAQVDSLQAWVTNHASLAEENRRLRTLNGLAARAGHRYRAASVFQLGNGNAGGTVVLDLGHQDGVHAASPVITPAGLAGRVTRTDATLSIGIDWTHPDFRASVMTEDGQLYGIVRPETAAFQEVSGLLLSAILYDRRLPRDALIVTSGRGGVFPRGVPVGRIGDEAEVSAGWQRSYWVYPLVDPASMTHVLVGVTAEEHSESEAGLFGGDTASPAGSTELMR